MPESRNVKRRKAIQRQSLMDNLFEQWRETLPKAAINGTPLVRFRMQHLRECWEAAYVAGRRFQHEQIARLLCPACMKGLPVILRVGVPTHDMPTDGGIWRKTCDAQMLYAFKP